MIRFRIYLTCCLIIYFVNTVCGSVIIAYIPENRAHDKDSTLATNKVAFVKRIVPHGYKTPQFEYDRKHKTIFAPKYRVHQPFQKGKLLSELHNLFNPIKVSPNAAAILKMMAGQNGRVVKYLRSPLEELGKGVYDPDGQVIGRPEQVEDDDDHVPKQEFNFPHFSFYNTWTYDKAMFHDQCPLPLAKVGHKCIYAPWA